MAGRLAQPGAYHPVLLDHIQRELFSGHINLSHTVLSQHRDPVAQCWTAQLFRLIMEYMQGWRHTPEDKGHPIGFALHRQLGNSQLVVLCDQQVSVTVTGWIELGCTWLA